MSEIYIGLFGVLIGALISIVTISAQLFHENKRAVLARKMAVFHETINAAARILQVAEQEPTANPVEHQDLNRENRESRYLHFSTVAKLRLEGYVDLANQFIVWSDLVNSMERSRRQSVEGWNEIRNQAFRIIENAEEIIKDLEGQSYLKKEFGIINNILILNNKDSKVKSSFFENIWNNFRRNSAPEILFWLITAVFIAFLAINIGLKFQWAFLLSLFVLVGTTFLDVRKETVVLTTTLLLGIATFSLQRQDFELRSRPYINLYPSPSLDIPGTFRLAQSGPEIGLLLQMTLGNHGEIPASISNIRVRASDAIEKLVTKDAVPFGPFIADQKSQWRNIDIFPYLEGSKAHEGPLNRKFYLTRNHMIKLFGKDFGIGEKSDPNSLTIQQNPLAGAQFYMIVELEYRGLYEKHEKNTPYYYWIIYKYKDEQFKPIESGVNKKLVADF